RLLAHLYLDNGDWVQGEMLRDGMARVYSFADNRALIGQMLALEGAARQARRGIWAEPFYRVRNADSLEGLFGTFQVIEGTVRDAQTVRKMTYLNFSDDWRTDFTISITRRALKSFAALGLDPLTLKGRKVRVRGWIKKRNGPLIEASHPEQIEIIDK
ncbi:MAG TPA: thermonuclease family protein, partial [Rhodospirillales bacterium]|nr:thermonuclease family protein [Rhodospirillales bacterium]